MSKLNKLNMKQARTDAEMADVTLMAREIEERLKPEKRRLEINIMGVTRVYEVEVRGQQLRLEGPERVKLSHNKNSSKIGDICPELVGLVPA